jgi:hypothetical protein
MTITVTTIANSQSFGAWLSTTNRLANIVSQNTVTVDTSSGGSLSTGNGYVNGYFGANYLYVANGLSGGNVSSGGLLSIISNVAFKYSTSNLITLTANSTSSDLNIAVGNANITANTISITGNTNFANAVVFSNAVTWSSTQSPVFNSNVTVNNAISVGNTTVNAVINSTSLALSNSTVSYVFASPNSAQYAANNYYLNANGQWVQFAQVSAGGSNTQVQFNDSTSFGGTAGFTFNKTSNTLTVGTATVNSTTINSTAYNIGTSLIANASGVYTTGTVNAASITTSGVSTNTSGVYPSTNTSGSALGSSTQRWIINANTINTSGNLTIGTSSGINANGTIGLSGQVLSSNGTSVYWSNISGVGSGTTLTDSVTLTNTSPAAMTITPSAAGSYATLPNATTCSKGTTLFAIYNAGDYDYGVKNNTGTVLGWVKPRTGAIIGLSDNTTIAGVWSYYGLSKLGITAVFNNATATNGVGNGGVKLVRVSMDADRTCFVFGFTSVYAIVYNASTQSWGSPTLIRSSVTSTSLSAVKSATDQVLVATCLTTALEAVTLSLSGTTVTVNSGVKATATLSGNIFSEGMGDLIAVGASFVLAYGRATTTSAIRAISISTNTPTIGAEEIINTGTLVLAPRLFASGSVVRTISTDGPATTIVAAPYTVSGSTLTAGTAATISSDSQTGIRAFVNGNGNIVIQYRNVSATYGAIVKLTGTTEAISAVGIGSGTGATNTTTDYLQITASKTLFVYYSSTTWYANILTDTSGTASAGTEISYGMNSTISSVMSLTNTGNLGKVAISGAIQATLDCSGTSPTLQSLNSFLSTIPFLPSNINGTPNPLKFVSGNTCYYFYSATLINGLAFLGNNIIQLDPLVLGGGQRNIVTGAASNESFVIGSQFNGTGFYIQRFETAE